MKISEVTSAEKEAFISLQRAFMNTGILHHYNPDRNLYADLDSSKQGMGAMIYHSEIDPPTQKSVQPIMFLLRLLKPAEENYWPTELEIARLSPSGDPNCDANFFDNNIIGSFEP
ncbi:hypothetical protein GcC1_n183043 [Golovinomyces cichoracearum]|uniref:Reverse transcriptase/retrotransposon-derived protein RNase H-like domain-containing protein n=1 Tax=Golovinomyces cichoracearum TaxID=62708 RepID=A0A420HLU7_9PEZI|nr:hypothetical protein GcC1_n183043 [Golovinomyces cichoracearum]